MIKIDENVYVNPQLISAIHWDDERKRTFIYSGSGYVSTDKTLDQVLECISEQK